MSSLKKNRSIWRCLHLMFSTTNVWEKWNMEKWKAWRTTRRNYKSCGYHPDSECCAFFHGNLSDSKSSEDTLLYLYVILNMLKSTGLHETILMLVICHDGVTLYFWMKFPSVARKKTRNGQFSIYQQISAHSKWKQQKKKKKKSLIERS